MPANPSKPAPRTPRTEAQRAADKRRRAAKKVNGGVNAATKLPHTKTFIGSL